MRLFFLSAMAAAAAALVTGETPAAAGGPGIHWEVPLVSAQFGCPGMFGDYRSYDWRAGYGRRPWRCDVGARFHRSALEDGFFGHGRVTRGGFDYDRGYPYDYYPVEEPHREPRAHEWADSDELSLRDGHCETVMVRDDLSRGRAPVRICRN